ncbi:hypothetical protein Lepto1489_09615 [Leptospira interrogans serovar Bataviae]|uniref:Uncharacterized protein n=1 Tax=Leptospira interrogans serovar Bataviae TaxID=312175 RepID=A0AAP9WJ78_LEPIR|nr:hypothetical protein Lepto1489_09615 [Leptospira interrogans serovar Bataviae]
MLENDLNSIFRIFPFVFFQTIYKVFLCKVCFKIVNNTTHTDCKRGIQKIGGFCFAYFFKAE